MLSLTVFPHEKYISRIFSLPLPPSCSVCVCVCVMLSVTAFLALFLFHGSQRVSCWRNLCAPPPPSPSAECGRSLALTRCQPILPDDWEAPNVQASENVPRLFGMYRDGNRSLLGVPCRSQWISSFKVNHHFKYFWCKFSHNDPAAYLSPLQRVLFAAGRLPTFPGI